MYSSITHSASKYIARQSNAVTIAEKHRFEPVAVVEEEVCLVFGARPFCAFWLAGETEPGIIRGQRCKGFPFKYPADAQEGIAASGPTFSQHIDAIGLSLGLACELNNPIPKKRWSNINGGECTLVRRDSPRGG